MKISNAVTEPLHTTTVPHVSVVIPTYGRKQFLTEAVASVIQQSFADWELYIVDDASPVPVNKQDFNDRRIKVLRHKCNKGPGAARNTGVRNATGRWLAFLDDDDLWDPHRLEYAIEWAASTRADICVASMHRRLEGNCHANIMVMTAPHLGATMIRREAFVPFNESYRACEDLDWWIRVTKHANVTTLPMPLYVWRRHDAPRENVGTHERIANSWRLLTDHRDYFDKYVSARAFRLFRLGIMLEQSGASGQAAAAYWRAAASGGLFSPRTRAAALVRLMEVLPRALLSTAREDSAPVRPT